MRKWMGKLALAGSSLVFVALVLEFALRVVVTQGGPPMINLEDERLGHVLKPNLDLEHLWDARESQGRIRTNAIGLRGRDVPDEKSLGEFRILMLGDSYTFGYGVDEDETVSALLDVALNERFSEETVVINAGVSAYGTGNQLLQFETLGRNLKADVVVLNVFLGNDIQENLCIQLLSQEPLRRPPCFVLEDGHLRERQFTVGQGDGTKWQPSLAQRVVGSIRGTRLLAFASQQGKRVLTSNAWVARMLYALGVEVHPGYMPHIVTGWYTPKYADPGWELTRALILQLRDDVVATGARFAIVLIPSRIQVLPGLRALGEVLYAEAPDVQEFMADPTVPQRRVAAFAAAEDIPLLDLRPVLAEHPAVEELYFPVIAHWNAEGHRVAARETLEFLVSEELTRPASSSGSSSQPASAIKSASASPESR